MKKAKKYETLYRINDATGRIVIDIALNDYLEFFTSGIMPPLESGICTPNWQSFLTSVQRTFP